MCNANRKIHPLRANCVAGGRHRPGGHTAINEVVLVSSWSADGQTGDGNNTDSRTLHTHACMHTSYTVRTCRHVYSLLLPSPTPPYLWDHLPLSGAFTEAAAATASPKDKLPLNNKFPWPFVLWTHPSGRPVHHDAVVPARHCVPYQELLQSKVTNCNADSQRVAVVITVDPLGHALAPTVESTNEGGSGQRRRWRGERRCGDFADIVIAQERAG